MFFWPGAAIGANGSGLYSLNQRFGICDNYALTKKMITSYDYQKLGQVGWYTDGETDYSSCPGPIARQNGGTIDRITVIAKDSHTPALNAAQQIYQSHPTWFNASTPWQIGSRPGLDCYTTQPSASGPRYYQTDQYASDFHLWHDQIKSIDSKFQVMTGSIVLGNLTNYKDDNFDFIKNTINDYYRQTHQQMPIDVFNVQIIIGPDTAAPLDTFKSAVKTFRQWLLSAGYSKSEMRIGYGISDNGISQASAVDFLQQSTKWLMDADANGNFDSQLGLSADGNRLVQAWAWYPLNDPSTNFQNSSLFDSNGHLTSLGLAYADLVPQHTPEPGSILILIFGAGTSFFYRKRH